MDTNNYSLSDLAAVTGGNGLGMGGNGGLLFLIVLFLLIGGIGGYNRGGDYGQYATAASQQDILFSSKFQALDNKIDRIGNGIADATYALNNSVTSEGRNIQMQLANCCCDNQRNVDSVRYDMANFAAATNANVTAQTQKILDAITGNRMADMQNQINALQLQSALCGVVRYPSATTYNAGPAQYYNGGCCSSM